MNFLILVIGISVFRKYTVDKCQTPVLVYQKVLSAVLIEARLKEMHVSARTPCAGGAAPGYGRAVPERTGAG